LEANYLFIAPQSVTSSAASSGKAGSPTLTVPFFDVTTGTEAAPFLTNPHGVAGLSSLRISNQLEGSELDLVGTLFRNDNFRLTGLVGFRYLRFEENLEFFTANSSVGQAFSSEDSFIGTNNFYGGQLGLRGAYQFGSFFIEATGEVALGSVSQAVDVNGASNAVNRFAPAFNFKNVPAGIFALPTNSGHHTQAEFGVLPEADVNVGYNITRHIQAFVGYSFLYLNDVARPGTTIDQHINPSQVPGLVGSPLKLTGPAAPLFSFSRSDFWAQGINFGLSLRF
jgi:hypothetical protein